MSDCITHTVKKGESLGSIARKYHVTVSNIKVDDLPPSAAERIREGMRVTSVDEAEELLESYRTDLEAKSKEATTA